MNFPLLKLMVFMSSLRRVFELDISRQVASRHCTVTKKNKRPKMKMLANNSPVSRKTVMGVRHFDIFLSVIRLASLSFVYVITN